MLRSPITYNSNMLLLFVKTGNSKIALKIMSSYGDKLVAAKWTQHKVLSYLARIQMNGWDRFGVYNSITNTITKELNISMRTINLHGHDGVFNGTIDLYVHNTSDLNNLILNLMKKSILMNDWMNSSVLMNQNQHKNL